MRSYPKIYNLGHRALKDFFDVEYIVVEEKIDGSQFSFGVYNGELQICSKGADIYLTNPPKMFRGAVETVSNLYESGKLIDSWIYRGEVLENPRHNALTYNRIPNGHIYLFDVEIAEATYLKGWEKCDIAMDLGLEPVWYQELPTDILSLDFINESLLTRESSLGGPTFEGVIFKRMPDEQVYDLNAKVLIAKHVSEAFKQTADKRWKRDNPSRKDIIQQIKDHYRTDMRWEHAWQHLRDDGKLDNSPKDIGAIIKHVHEDLVEEEGDDIQQMLFNHFIKEIKGGVTAGLAEWYKKKLAGEQFGVSSTQVD